MATPQVENNWTLVIKPKRSLWEVNLKELWEYRDLLYLLVRRDFVAKYKQTILGPLWFLLQPFLTTVLFTFVFGHIAKIPTDGLPHILFYMAGIVIWNYFSKSLTATSNTFVGNAGLFGKVYFPRLIIPLSIVVSNLFQFFIQFLLLLFFMAYYYFLGVRLHLTWFVLILPYLIILAAGLGLGFGILISSLTTKYRDLSHLVGFGMQLWMYITPIVYPLSKVPPKYAWIVALNPMTPIVEGFRKAILGVGTVNFWQLLYSTGFMIFMLIIGVLIFNKVEQNFMDTV